MSGTASDAPSDDPDVLVVGGGPAGSTVARLLALAGWRVDLVDRARFPRPKACGECLNPGAVAALARLGLLERVAALGPAVLHGWRIEAGASAAIGSFPRGGSGLALPRARLDAALLDAAAEAGVRVEQGVRVLGPALQARAGSRTAAGGGSPLRVAVREPSGGVSLRRAGLLVGADGLRSTVARGMGAEVRPSRLRKLSLTLHLEGIALDPARGLIRLDARGTVGLAPLDPEGRRWNATVVVDPAAEGRAVAGDAAGFALARLEEALGARARATLVDGPWASGPFDRPAARVVDDGTVLVGDAAGYFDPLTGQGIYRALRSAELAACAIDRALRAGRVSGDGLGGYGRRLRRELRAPLYVQRGVEAVISRRRLRVGAIAALARAPRAMDALIGVTGDAAAASTLLRPALWAELLTAPLAGGSHEPGRRS